MAAAGVLLVDKPGGMTSHDVVARARKALGTRKIGHAGTLDPMATGLLILGVEAATRLLTFIVGLDKTYKATIRLGATTDTDDADGEIRTVTDAAGVTSAAVIGGDRRSHGRDLADSQSCVGHQGGRPTGVRSGARRRGGRTRRPIGDGLAVRRARRTTRVDGRAARRRHGDDAVLDLDVVVDCTSGTYVRALARDLGAALGVGGHLTALRRTRIGPFGVDGAASVGGLADAPLRDSRARSRRRCSARFRVRRRSARPPPRKAPRRRSRAARPQPGGGDRSVGNARRDRGAAGRRREEHHEHAG